MKIPANAQDVSYDKTLSSETVHSCNSHYGSCMHNNLCNVSGGERAVETEKEKVIYFDHEHGGLMPCPVLQACVVLCL